LPADSAIEPIVAELRERLSESAVVTLTPYKASRRPRRQGEQYVLTATGELSAGAVATLSSLVAERGGNFTDFDYRADDGRISVIAEVELPADSALDQLQIDLQHAGAAVGLQVRLQHQKLFVATNEIAFRRVNYDS